MNRRSILSRIAGSQLPTARIKGRNALFEYQLMRLPWPGVARRQIKHLLVLQKLRELREYTLSRAILWPFAAALAAIALTLVEQQWSGILLLLIVVNLGYSLFSNINYVVTTINTVTPQIAAVRWEALRLTSLTDSDILLATHAITQVQVWRPLLWDIGLRVFASVTSIGLVIDALARTKVSAVGPTYLIVSVILFIIVVAVIGIILEPLWRMRAVTMLAMTLTIWIDNYALTVMITFAAVFALLMLELILSIVITGMAYSYLDRLPSNSTFTNADTILAFSVYLSWAIVVIAGVYLLFMGIRALCFWQLKRVAFHE